MVQLSALEGFVKREPVGDVERDAMHGVCCVVIDEGETRRRQMQRWSSVCSPRVSVLVPHVRRSETELPSSLW